MIADDTIQRIAARFRELEASMAGELGELDGEAFVRISREYAELRPVMEAVESYRAARRELADLEEMAADPDSDADMRALAAAEIETLRDRLPGLEMELQLRLLPKDAADEKNAILEVRAGTGGDEAALFAADLVQMYQRYADLHGWRVETLSYSETDIGGCKEGIFSIAGTSVFARLKYESGVHRVQRVPATESGGRIHTSAATVAVLPEAEEVDIAIDEKDLRIDVFRASGPGGQSVNTTDSAVRITHLPTGIVVQQQDEKSQHKNRAKALKVLRARLYEQERANADRERAAARKSQVGSGDRSERVRTYNFPQGRVTDHRINLTLYKLDRVIAGEALDEVIDALTAADQAEQLAEMRDDPRH
ncbi:peptide chain release factor 1 [Oceanibacterium hippocampi]|uniref:Peptide chain release factor 1 n=1 Tax=Oceanibacterium hippocampi TaxID=745714 RepID=A0A1Y5R625_9PROT|nr:peptide chain release factor 1 [Oceanibacterium hippocampi]SLN09936.1 Peptide chain release factor 1 [Oceanibacterium hippocampi]